MVEKQSVSIYTPSSICQKAVKKCNFEKYQQVVFTDKIRMELESKRHYFLCGLSVNKIRLNIVLNGIIMTKKTIYILGTGLCRWQNKNSLICRYHGYAKYCTVLQKKYFTRYMNKMLKQLLLQLF